jgi:hypothetical protein
MAAGRAKKRRKFVLRPGYEQLTSMRLQRMPSLLGQDTAGAGQNIKTRLAETTSIFLRAVLWLAVGPFGNVRGDPLQNEFPDEIPHRALANARQTIEND